jgi:hypothetical protein
LAAVLHTGGAAALVVALTWALSASGPQVSMDSRAASVLGLSPSDARLGA